MFQIISLASNFYILKLLLSTNFQFCRFQFYVIFCVVLNLWGIFLTGMMSLVTTTLTPWLTIHWSIFWRFDCYTRLYNLNYLVEIVFVILSVLWTLSGDGRNHGIILILYSSVWECDHPTPILLFSQFIKWRQ